MRGRVAPENRELSHVVERQMRNWEIARRQKVEALLPPETGLKDFLAISRAVGLPGLRIASKLGERLGWPVFVRQVLEVMAGNDDYLRQLYAVMDERDVSWLENIALSMGLGKVGKEDYFHRLTRTVLSIARTGNAVFLGHAADLILPRNAGFRVALAAPREYCLKCYAEQKHLQPAQAEREVRSIEKARAAFIRRHFRISANDPCRCDLVVNMERFNENQVVEMILSAARIHGLSA
ncbi:MAG TPA: cytidylate kinase-like family protein [Phycisphaerae bacterium]|nr:cytidylate kinase-like family protein [Phycisphaerae bacterium]